MDVLLLAFMLTLMGDGNGIVVPFPTMAACEKARSEFMQEAVKLPVSYVAAVCVTPTKVQGA